MAFLFFAGMTSLLPVIHIFPIYGYFYETYAYLMAAFFAGLVAIGMRNLINFFRNWGGEKMGIIAAVAPILVILILAKLTWKQNMVWANPIQLWVNAYQFTPESAKVNNNLGLAYVRNNQIREAIPYLEASVRLTPQNSAYQESLAYAYLETGQQALVVTQLNAFLTTTDAVRACGAIERLFSEYHVEELFAKLTDCNNK
jgi:tetratricopeptide (TPR) repeat protein